MTTELVASIAAESTEELLRLAAEKAARADIVELRVDGVDRPDLDRLFEARPKKTIFTCRAASQGGAFQGLESERLATLARARELGFEYVDVELAALDAPLPPSSLSRLILSHHDFEGVPENGAELVERALALGADVVKLACRVESLADTLRLAELGERVREAGRGFAPVPMGPAGASGRILAARFGAAFAYASIRGGRATGPGQLALDALLDRFHFRAIGADTEVYGILGAHALASLSPSMHNAWLEHVGRNGVYVPFEESDLARFVEGARRLPVHGLSVTNPFKETILEHLDEIDPVAERIGAVNTVVVREGRWLGLNTDYLGVSEPLARFGSWRGKRAAILGAGGAARAAAYALRELGAETTILARRAEAARALANELGGLGASTLSRLEEVSYDLVVNATPVGSASAKEQELEGVTLAPETVVFDMVTVPVETPLVRRAREASARVVTGLDMLAAQAVHQAILWTGERPELNRMLAWAREGTGLGRYSRQVLFKDIGERGQRSIRERSVVVIGLGALGSVSSDMLVRAGVGRLRVVDRDYVDVSNLQRQSLYDEADLAEGLPKAIAASRKLGRINGDVAIEALVEDAHAGNILALLEGADLVLDGTDNFETRYLLNDAAVRLGVPWIYAACVGSYGMSFAVVPGRTPCLRCFIESLPAPGTSPTCDTAGVIAPAVHAVAAFQVAEALKILAGREDALVGTVLSLDVWQGRVDSFRPSGRRADCPACGERRFDFLEGASESQAVTLCGRNAVQVRPAAAIAMPLGEVARRLLELGEVTVNDYLLRARFGDRELVLFKDGRAIVHGTDDPAEARSLYARYVGS